MFDKLIIQIKRLNTKFNFLTRFMDNEKLSFSRETFSHCDCCMAKSRVFIQMGIAEFAYVIINC